MNIDKYEYPELKPFDQDWRWVHKYCHDILKGKVPACKAMKWAAMRHFRDLERDDVYLDEEAAASIVLWFKFCPIIKGEKSGQPTVLDPSQIFIAVSLIAWKWSHDIFEMNEETGVNMHTRHAHKRRYNQFYGQVSRKYGKTTFTAGIKLYLMYKYKYGARVFSLATKKDQAKEVWSVAHKMVKMSPRLSEHFHPRANDILIPSREGEFKALASDSNSLDGLDPMAACLDECHAIKDRNLYGVLISAFGSNEGGEFLFSVITTAGFILDGLCTDLYKNGLKVLDPNDETNQDNYFYVIFELDTKDPENGIEESDEWSEEANWYKSNPALVYGRPSIQYLRDRYKEASMSTEEKANFITKHCNLFISGADKWLDINEVKACRVEGMDIAKYKGRKLYAAVDRSNLHDITSFCLMFPMDDGGVDIFFKNFLPRKTAQNVTPYLQGIYRKAEAAGDLELLDTATIRDKPIRDFMVYLNDEYSDLELIGYDPYKMKEIAEDLEAIDVPVVSVGQSIANMSEPAKKLEGLIKEGLLRYDSPLFEYACTCAIIGKTKFGNVSVYRENDKTDKIDPLIATIIALSCATLISVESNIYDSRDVLSF